ncbi:Trafficking protein particle complex subunit 12 [Durusdinium trenchii]|uniref:Trafficking protein particle complex subunit 12 n=1 Tax=Durusdinium trenchii TaxID=1381693 RepID=A0ABP0HHF8_9DINO
MAERAEDALFALCSRVWRGDAEQVLEVVTRDEAFAARWAAYEGWRVLAAALLLKLGKLDAATERIEQLQQSRLVAAKVLCAIVTFEWNERSTAVDMLHKLLAVLREHRAKAAGEAESAAAEGSKGSLLDMMGQPLTSAGASEWRLRITSLLVSCYASSGDYALAIDLCEQELATCSDVETCAVLLHTGRVRLQVGDLEGARDVLGKLKCHELKTWTEEVGARILEGMTLYAECKYQTALELFGRLRDDCAKANAGDEPYLPDHMLAAIIDIQEPLEVTLANNYALCSLHVCDLGGAIEVLEACIHKDPRRNLHRAVVFNLCTLYDLAKPKDQSQVAKLKIKELAEQFGVQARFDDVVDLRLSQQ